MRTRRTRNPTRFSHAFGRAKGWLRLLHRVRGVPLGAWLEYVRFDDIPFPC